MHDYNGLQLHVYTRAFMMSFLDLGPVIFGGNDKIIAFLRSRGVGVRHGGCVTQSWSWVHGRRDAATLLPIIQAHSAPGTIIHSDEWSAYRRVSSLPTHSTVNHSLHFVDPATGTHTQNIESYWGRVKRRIKKYERVPCF